MSIRSELHEAIIKRGGKVPVNGGIAAALDELNRLPGGGVSSWNDLTDKPFYEETGMVEVLAECQPPYNEETGFHIADSELPFVVGETYIVNWNGVEYSCIAQDLTALGGGAGLGDLSSLAELDENLTGNGEPFVVMANSGITVAMALDSSTSVTISIRQETTVIHPIEGKYLPKGTPWMVGEVYLEESDASSFTHPSFGTMWVIYKAVKLEVGETYTVIYNGTSYNCVCQAAPSGLIEDSNAVAMGNFSVVGGENTGEPFAMLISYAHREVNIIDLSSASSVKCAIHAVGTIINKLDEACLPDTMIVTVDSSTMTADKTCGEIWEAMQNKQNVFLVIQSGYGLAYSPCAQCVPDAGAIFFLAAVSETNGEISSINSMETVCVKPDGSVLINL